MRRKDHKTTTIRISVPAHDLLREMSYTRRETITEIIDYYVGVKKRNHHSLREKPDTRKKHIRVKPLTTLEKLLRDKK